jgi:hypothetical protein
MNLKLFLLSFFFFFSIVYAQFPIPEEFLTFPVYIKLARGGTATGFYYSDSTNFYLVTAKHVFFDPNTGKLNSENAELISYPRDPYKNPYNLLKCDLKLLLDRNLVVFHKQFDVAVALIGNQEKIDSVNMLLHYNEAITKPDPKASRVNQFTPMYILESKDLPVGTEVHIFGYPTSVGIKEMPQLELTQPLLRRGIVAGKNYKLNTIILDCPVYKGNSGGPVVASLYSGLETKFRLIGIVSEFVPFEEKWINDKYGYANVEFSNSGYSIIAPIEIMLELIKQFK